NFSRHQINAQEKGMFLRILPQGPRPLNQLAALLDRDRFPLIFSAYRNLNFHDAAHKFFNADLGSSSFYVGTWFLNHPRHLQLKVLANTTAAVHFYQKNTPAFLKDARLNVKGIKQIPMRHAPSRFARLVLQENPLIYLSRELKIETRFWNLWGNYLNLYFLIRQLSTAVQAHKKRYYSIISEAQSTYYKLLSQTAYRIVDLNTITYLLLHQPEQAHFEIIHHDGLGGGEKTSPRGQRWIRLTLTPLANTPDFNFKLVLPLLPEENPTTLAEALTVKSGQELYMFIVELHQHLRQLHSAMDRLAKANSDHLRELINKIGLLRDLPTRIIRDAAPLNFLALWQDTFISHQEKAQLSMGLVGQFYVLRGHAKKRITCASLLSARRSPWINYLHDFLTTSAEK
ncbi:MAG: hypothetical protein J6Y94_05045, partial [Bacteriovoracaceae bacterium]|nr:hypothetical protein [Bacteriovoracaceae bacterium]